MVLPLGKLLTKLLNPIEPLIPSVSQTTTSPNNTSTAESSQNDVQTVEHLPLQTKYMKDIIMNNFIIWADLWN